MDAVVPPDVMVTPLGTVHANVFAVEAVLNVVLGVPSHKVVVPVIEGVGLTGLFTTELALTAAHGAFVTAQVKV